MREIKFRGKRIDTGQWVYGHYFKSPLTDENSGAKQEDGWFFLTGIERHCIEQDHVSIVIDPDTLGQFTGLKDKNGKEIYEGDIFPCLYAFDGCTEHVMVVEWNEKRAAFLPRWDYTKCQQKAVQKTMNDLPSLEIIGNIYENPELSTEK
jgi:uncharacterized phage protein (TIGR01671 family)